MITETHPAAALRFYGDPVLRRRARPVLRVDDSLRDLATSMLATMHAREGLGLAAEQIGDDRAVCVIDLPPAALTDERNQPLYPGVSWPLVLINPALTEVSAEKEVVEEGCLSFPGIYAPVRRAVHVVVRYTGLDGVERDLAAGGLLGRAVQHELDHLNGVLFIDRIPQIKRLALSARLKRLRRDYPPRGA